MNAKSAFALWIQNDEFKRCSPYVFRTMNAKSAFALWIPNDEFKRCSPYVFRMMNANPAFILCVQNYAEGKLCFFSLFVSLLFKGPAPSAITAVYINDTTQVLVIANGVVGGLYTYSVTTGPVVNFEGFLRRGQAGLTWNDAYARSDDAVGEPYITDLL